MPQRSTRDVLEDHLRLRAAGDIETDLERNYADDIVLFVSQGVRHGKDWVRESVSRLHAQLPSRQYEYVTCLTDGEMGFLEWKARSDRYRVEDGADSYLIRDDKIRAQTIHYTLQEP
jgi:ketosteroid isomerase-like protein